MLDAVAHQPPRQVFALVAAGRSLARARYREAIGLLEEAAPAAGTFQIFQRRMATALLCSGDRSEAERWMRTAVAASASATNIGYLAIAVGGLRWDCADPASVSELAAGGNASEAIRWGRQAASLSTGPDQQLWLGVAAELAVRARDTSALRSIVGLLGFDAPQSVAALRYLAWLHVFDGDMGEADVILDRLRARSGHAPRAQDLRAAASLAP